MTRITGIGVGAAAKVGGVVFIAFGLITGVIMSLVFLMGGQVSGMEGGAGLATGVMVGVSLVVVPGIMGIYGIVIGALWAWIYNLTARWHGGFVLTLKQES